LLLIVIVMGGIYTGMFTPTEAGFLGVVTYWPGLSTWFPRMLGMM
jgi:TRAP-type C4-dicarboxylate transport system permease large subunit